MLFDPPARPGLAKRAIARIASSYVVAGRPRLFRNIIVHPTQEMRDPDGAFFRGGPDWPRFNAQTFARHCWGTIPRAIDRPPLPCRPDWPYFDPQFLPLFWPHLGIDPHLSPPELDAELARLAATHAPLPHQVLAAQDSGFWCGPISLHFGHMVADFSMRIAASSRSDPAAPLVFSLPPLREPDPPPFFWQIIDHLGVERARVLLLRQPTRFRRLYVLPQAERPFGGGPNRRHLDVLDALTRPGC